MLPRQAISDADWDRIKGRRPGRPGQPGWVAAANRRFVDAVLGIARTGGRRRRCDRWSRKGTGKLVRVRGVAGPGPRVARAQTRPRSAPTRARPGRKKSTAPAARTSGNWAAAATGSEPRSTPA